MKKLLILFTAFFALSSLIAQNRHVGDASPFIPASTFKYKNKVSAFVESCDTLSNIGETDSLVLYESGTWGFVGGHNDYLDQAKADIFTGIPLGYKIKGAILGFGFATSGTQNASIDVKVWNANPASINPKPEEVLATKSIFIQQIAAAVNNDQFIYVAFDSAVMVPKDAFFLGIQYQYNPGDTVGLITNKDQSEIPATAWELRADSTWWPYHDDLPGTYNTWEMYVAHAIWVLLCTESSGVEKIVNAAQLMKVYPNPAEKTLNISFDPTLYPDAEIRIMDLSGKIILYEKLNTQKQLDVSSLASGMYFVDVKSTGFHSSEKLIIR